jgi:hypothetical protein
MILAWLGKVHKPLFGACLRIFAPLLSKLRMWLAFRPQGIARFRFGEALGRRPTVGGDLFPAFKPVVDEARFGLSASGVKGMASRDATMTDMC